MDWFLLINSLRIAGISTGIIFFVGIFGAYYIAKAPRAIKSVLDVILTLPLASPVRQANYVGICMHDICRGGTENTVRCRVAEVIENPFSYTIMLRPVGVEASVPVGWELNKETWGAICADEVDISLPPEALLLLEDE